MRKYDSKRLSSHAYAGCLIVLTFLIAGAFPLNREVSALVGGDGVDCTNDDNPILKDCAIGNKFQPGNPACTAQFKEVTRALWVNRVQYGPKACPSPGGGVNCPLWEKRHPTLPCP